ncbi:hypothetical protein Loa_01320 [Legionella oakridgensis ATCC 33761 = DSM 21215]|uniref:Uncharacterized protein n=1 Tax=Legionella oakridgensis ATCC 33761 = DSM 21215 TaxID=1268635 RepID=W0B8L8_9GAMM|nr:hypothetical protein [Legionella oakridgensis]AHE66873.1 hypothetical protein Loa_01320 [Legionella oakridgensis ATCC 33761 = DSM 21215]
MKSYTTSETSHQYTPQREGGLWRRIRTTTSSTFKPMLTTSIPSTRDYQYTLLLREADKSYPQELRFGTQGQRHQDKPRVSPLFKEWLRQKNDKKLRMFILIY